MSTGNNRRCNGSLKCLLEHSWLLWRECAASNPCRGEWPGYAWQTNGYPFHLIGQASLEALNQGLDHPLSMDRFRPSIVITGVEPFAEDRWQTIRINTHCFYLVKPCNRCAVTMVDQKRGERAGKEPLKTLVGFRRFEKQVFFGRYMLSSSLGGTVKVGDPVEVLA